MHFLNKTMSPYEQLQIKLKSKPETWLITGVAGFIGSNLLETLLRLDQRVLGWMIFLPAKKPISARSKPSWRQNNGEVPVFPRRHLRCRRVSAGVRRGAFRSARSGARVRAPFDGRTLASHAANVTGFLNMLIAAATRR